MKGKVLACQTMADEVQKVLPPDLDLELLPYALHRVPQRLQSELQKRIDADTDHDTLLFGYGLCSYGVVNLCSERHTLVIPRVHDCISLLMGAREIYDREFAKHPATIYLSKGWIDQGAEPLAEFKNYAETYGNEDAQWMIDTQYKHYQRVVLIDTGVGCREELALYTRSVARFLNVAYDEHPGSVRLLTKLFRGDWDREFVVIPPGRMVMQRSFL
ncbi:Domain of unknown function DUF1638 [Acididesulfobacillus acetoxydans]|uniref:DUF1638 domain-containing protein n=1 Tax=Acididesulfobacillus acetoxydans TaxID=1561005 RepID=A0A8S0XVV3_9FIRM|nr:DUF1638 domain-containing protein [Acididesulfobacillus acetoxydans]CAA7600617.1 Domain of unknown function DUF1638 [Acididesulfobacillus acetoxydans]CEJ09398.1 Protein of unknown function (DUF1638) [Acididesulfobacillus acetoxydans]